MSYPWDRDTYWDEVPGLTGKIGDFVSSTGSALAEVVGLDDEQIKHLQIGIASLPFVGQLYADVDKFKKTNDYLTNTGQSWSDILYPSSQSYPSVGMFMNFVSKNVGRLYE